MYSPKQFIQTDETKLRELVEQNSFATLLSFPEGDYPFINHLPLIWTGERRLTGHMSKKNPQWRHFAANPKAAIIINGPHTYITPRWYKSGRDVPTWNYAVAHLYGRIELMAKFDDQISVLTQLSAFFERPSTDPWAFELPADLYDEKSLTAAIISFNFHIEKFDAKFKFSQNRPVEDRMGVIEGLGDRDDEQSRLVREIMIENEAPNE